MKKKETGNTMVLKEVRKAMRNSDLVQSISKAKKKKQGLTPLAKQQRALLEKQGNICDDWSKVYVKNGFRPERVKNSTFSGKVILGDFSGMIEISPGIELPAGIYNSTVMNCQIDDHVLIRDVKAIINYVVKKGAIILNNGLIECNGRTNFGNGGEISVAIETGGREVAIFAELAVDLAAFIAASRSEHELLKNYGELVNQYRDAISSDRGIIEEGALVRNNSKIVNTYVGTCAYLDNTCLVSDSTILSNKEEMTEISDGAYVKKALVQWGCRVTSSAIVVNSLLNEHSHVERHGKVTDSIIGANTGVAEGEVTASLVGPFVGFHHQALLIAAFWPEGKGNIGYGANVGSNHTAKAPDQEIWPGEGTFFGLGVNIKFPSDFTSAPYSIIATGITTLPQKVNFPFSLINTPNVSYEGISPAYNEIMPAWVLSNNIFAVKRNEGKYRKRNKAKRSEIEFAVFRKEIVELMIEARRRLSAVKEIKSLYTEKEIPGIGKNYLKESVRKQAIETYSFYIKYYALRGLLREVEERLEKGEKKNIASLFETSRVNSRWKHERKILLSELKENSIADNLKLLIRIQEKIATDVETSKEKDDQRGERIISDYREAHSPASEDAFVCRTWDETKNMRKRIKRILKIIG